MAADNSAYWANFFKGFGLGTADSGGTPGASFLASATPGAIRPNNNALSLSAIALTGSVLSTPAASADKPAGNPVSQFWDWMNQGDSVTLPEAIGNSIVPDAAPADGSSPSVDWGALVARGVIIVLGFIFVAVGLTLFGVRPAVQIVDGAKKAVGV